MANRKAPQAAEAVATKEATDSDSSAAEAAQENTVQTPQTAEPKQENTAQTPEQATAAPEAPAPAGEEKTSEGQAQTPPESQEGQSDEGREPTATGDKDAQAEVRQEPPLEDVAVLAIRHRVAAWEQAALMRMMGWADGKMIADADYRAALAKLHGRRLGGGRMV